MRRDDLRPVGDLLGSFKEGTEPQSRIAQLQSIWRETVGEQIAANCDPVGESDGVVRVICSSSVWAEEISLMAATLAEALNGTLSEAWVTGLEASTGRL